mmetsp:Transcript_5256/g.10020  ORF Transcript_5256/g.10020 Transcript_5256/m.10020 type:complete len:479 (-) Transcript_5256:117-1553(-)
MSEDERDEEKDPLQTIVDSIRNDAAINESTFLLMAEENLLPATPARQSARQELAGHRKSKSLSTLMSPSEARKKRPGHHRRKSSMTHIYESLSGGLSVIREGVVQEGTILSNQFQEDLKDANRGRGYFLDMALTRSLSIIPDEILEFAEEAVGVPVAAEAPPEANIIWRYVSLLGAVLAVSSNGTALTLLHDVPPALKLYWRMTATAVVLFVFAARATLHKGMPKLTNMQLVTFTGAVFCFFVHAILFYKALTMTSIGNAVIGANSQALILILAKFLVGETVLFMEFAGVIVAFTGCILCSSDEAQEAAMDDEPDNTALYGDLLALSAAVAGVGYLTCAKAVRPFMSVTVFMFLIMFCGSFLVLLYLLASGTAITFDNDPHSGLFGWATQHGNHLGIVIYIAIVCNVFGVMGFVRAMQYFENIIIAVATLLEPLTATMIAYFLGVGDLPGSLGWAGNALVVLGTLLVIYPSLNKPLEH